MKVIRFLWENLWDTGTLTYSEQNSNFPATNTRHRWHTRAWRSLNVTGDKWLKVDLGSAQDILAFAIKFNNFQTGATVKIQGNATDAWGSPSYEAILTPINNDIMVHFPTSLQSYRWWRLLMNDAGNPDGYMTVGRIFLGSYDALSKNFDRKYSVTMQDPSLISMSEGGQISSIQRAKFEAIGYHFGEITKLDKNSLQSIFDDRGIAKNFFITQDADDAYASTHYVRFVKNLKTIHVLRDAIFNVDIIVEELR